LRKIMPLLAGQFAVIAPDLPGHGFTDVPADAAGLSLPAMAAGIGELMRKLGAAPILAAGHSAGAAILIRATLDGEIKPAGIVSINGALLPFGSSAGRLFAPIARMMALSPFVRHIMAWRAQSPSAVERVLRGTGSTPSPEDVALYSRLFGNPRHVQSALGMMANWDLDSLARDLRRLTAELVLIVGQEDRAIPPADAERTASLVPSARIVRVAGAGHLAHEEKPGEIAEIVVETARRLSLLNSPARNS
jgi:magnesium chelatase accessory protein